MKIKFIIILTFFSFTKLFSQTIIGTYVIQDRLDFSTIELKNDNTFLYKHRGDFCFVWHEKKGTWEIDNNVLVLIDSVEWDKEFTQMEESYDYSLQGQIEVKVVNNQNVPIQNISIEYEDVFEKNFCMKETTNEMGIAIFNLKNYKFSLDSQNMQLKFAYNKSSDRFFFPQFPRTSNNKIKITINTSSSIEVIERKELYRISKNDLIGFAGNSLDSGMRYKKEE